MSERLEQLLPWLPIEALSAEEHREVKALLEKGGEAADLLAFARLLREAVQIEAQQERPRVPLTGGDGG